MRLKFLGLKRSRVRHGEKAGSRFVFQMPGWAAFDRFWRPAGSAALVFDTSQGILLQSCGQK